MRRTCELVTIISPLREINEGIKEMLKFLLKKVSKRGRDEYVLGDLLGK